MLAVVLIFLVLLFEFRSFTPPIAILSSAILSTSGVFVALLLTRTTFNVSSFMGLIMVIGIVAKNGILLLDANEKFRSIGFTPEEAIVQAGRRRLRPIVMTAMAAAAGMLPLALAIGEGSQMLQPLAIAVIGGILISMALSLIVTPAIQYLPDGAPPGCGRQLTIARRRWSQRAQDMPQPWHSVGMRVLLVEDEPSAAHLLEKGLREEAYAVDLATDGERALFQAATTDYDVVILDVMLPLKDGLDVCRTIRQAGNAVPILMVTARDAVEARIEGLDCGADDYLVKPFVFGELLARLRALVRRGRQPLLPDRVTVGALTLDTRSQCVHVEGRPVLLTAKEYALLEYLVRRAGDVVSRIDIAEHVWDEHYDPLSNVVDVYIQRLRRKLDIAGTESCIRTRRGEGYQLSL